MPDPSLSISEMVNYAKEQFDRSTASEFCRMCYYLAQKNGILDNQLSELLNDMMPAIQERDRPHQTIRIPRVDQFNNNPKIVLDNPKGVKKKRNKK